MYQKIICFMLVFFCLSFNLVNNVEAQKLKVPDPYIKSTEQWSVQIGNPILDEKDMAKPKSDIANMYSLVITNTGETLNNVIVEAYRNDPNSPTKYGLFSNPLGIVEHGKVAFQHKNFPVSVKADQVEIVISWEDSPTTKNGIKIQGRKYKQTFAFGVNRD
ncbi:hypothetical protein QFZ77_007466 [Paenibacillus sp. V4I3]|uniref:hypothetical protein n=1 Tax=Paenibacillus sp. V4I3 TaxID=3042305 RepID=UPI00277FE51F|nr:hypothetical protein [Paenibacillus sp. V4I3]MDQ0878807.1 hypothetical protein [Paenibacillus sp. V4I3]